ncbi:MAG TPA: polysaccharide deacetylase family protein [Solirubrobacteraceae bacterium]|nr:polysaccharide deacetylase family protein [Solirubrobacteraceae bacterium]
MPALRKSTLLTAARAEALRRRRAAIGRGGAALAAAIGDRGLREANRHQFRDAVAWARSSPRRAASFAVIAVAAGAGLVAATGASQDASHRAKAPRGAPVAPPPPPASIVGCTAHGPWLRMDGASPKAGKVVALTFDDGPSQYTDGFLKVLARFHAHATFFVIGNQVPGREPALQHTLAAGNAIGNHTFTHPNLAALKRKDVRAELLPTTRQIRRATGFRPCVFRPPFGAKNRTVISQARRLGMLTVIWSVDTRDYTRPGTSAIVQRVLSGVRPGGIVLMHDGGGDRSQTLAALPTILRRLKARGYRTVTLQQLFHARPVARGSGPGTANSHNEQ